MDTFNPNQMPPMSTQPEKKSVGPLVAVVVILALIIIAGLYFFKQRVDQPTYVPIEQTDVITESLKQQGTTDDLSSIEADLNATDLNNLDQGAAAIEAELQ